MLVKSEVLIVALTAIPLISSAPLLLAQPRQNNDVKLETTNDIQAQIKRLLKSESKDVSRIKVSTKNVMEMGLRQAAAISQSIYCSTIQERKWDCGKACQIVPDMQIQWTHGDNREIPYTYVAYSESMQAVIVVHAGSNFDSFHSWVTDFNFLPLSADSDLDDGTHGDDTATVHSGFHKCWRKTYKDIYKQVKKALKQSGYKHVLCTGHSLGAALAQMDAMYLRNRLPKDIKIQQVGFGSPRVGDDQWANLVGTVLGNNQVHITNYRDAVPHLPIHALGYQQPNNEIWIDQDAEEAVLCRGQENEECAEGVAKHDIDWAYHKGPYFGVTLDAGLCCSTDRQRVPWPVT